ncbi:MAG: GerMN domain-containing protein [Patescibacteria group bacterium]
MANQPAPAPATKSNTWLIIIIIIVIGAILWPILRKDSPSDDSTPTEDGTATSTLSLNDLIGDDSSVAVVPTSPALGDETNVSNVIPTSANQAAVAAAPSGSMTLRVYFGNKVIDPKTEKCEVVYPFIRTVPKTTAVGRAALTELLKGPSEVDVRLGSITSINPGVKLNSLTIVGGVARADFSSELSQSVGGACLTSMIRAQITETLKQFSTVKSVVISVNGVSQDILQP